MQEIQQAIDLLKSRGYRVASRTIKAGQPLGWNDPAKNTSTKAGEFFQLLVEFDTGETSTSTIIRDKGKWRVGEAIRAACDFYRYRSQEQWPWTKKTNRPHIDAIPVPKITRASVLSEKAVFNAASLNAETKEYRTASKTVRFGFQSTNQKETKCQTKLHALRAAHLHQRTRRSS